MQPASSPEGGTMTPSEFAATLDSRVATILSTVRRRTRSAVSTIQVRLTASLSTVRAPLTAAESSPADSAPADQSTTPPTPESDPSPDDAEPAPLPVLSEETGRDINDLLLERGVTREEYVREILEANDGRLRQQRIKQYTGWSAASVSRLLGRMEDSGTITRFRIGNEKVVCVPDADPRTDVFETEIAVSH